MKTARREKELIRLIARCTNYRGGSSRANSEKWRKKERGGGRRVGNLFSRDPACPPVFFRLQGEGGGDIPSNISRLAEPKFGEKEKEGGKKGP